MYEFPRKRFTDENWDVLEVVRELAEEKDATAAQVSLAWLLQKELVDAPIIGARTLDHLEADIGALEVALTDRHSSIETTHEAYSDSPAKEMAKQVDEILD